MPTKEGYLFFYASSFGEAIFVLRRYFMTKKLTTTGILLALSVVLSLLRLFTLPQCGSVTPASMLPIIIISLLYGNRWGILSGIVSGILSMLLTGGVPAPPVSTIWYYLLVLLLDYILAFGFLGLASFFFRLYGKSPRSIAFSAATVIFLRFLCHFTSGIFIWGVYAWEGYGAALYSLIYNGSYMLFELLITTALAFFARHFIKKQI